MRTFAFGLILGLASFCAGAARAAAPVTLAFQGMLNDKNGSPVTSPAAGTPVVLSLYADPAATTPVWTETQNVSAVGGLFTVALGSATPFASANLAFDRPYWIGMKVAGEASEMAPRLPLSAVPYALNAWSVGGNAGTDPAQHFLGTTDNQPLVLKANGHRILQVQDAVSADGTTRSPNILAGSEANTIAAGVIGGTVAGGGSDGFKANEVKGDYGVISGGVANFVDAVPYATIGGGTSNIADGKMSTVGGGSSNSADGDFSTVAGGVGNNAGDASATVGGGSNNKAIGIRSTVAGGDTNVILGDSGSILGGQGNQASGVLTTVGGGSGNIAGGLNATVAGGLNNQATAEKSFIGGGAGNKASSYAAVVAGGYQNTADSASAAVIGGTENKALGPVSIVGGGDGNSTVGRGTFVGSGYHNDAIGDFSTIGGGDTNFANDLYATIPGGAHNAAAKAAFAAGYKAYATHTGAFVWSDYSDDQFFYADTDNEFCIRAKGGLLLESFASPVLYTGQGATEWNRYLSLINSYALPSASGLKAGGILCSDSYSYASPGKNDMVVKGTLSVGYPNPSPYTFSVNGSIYARNGYASSDARYKKNVRPLDHALDTVASLRGVSFEWDREDWKDENFPEGRQIGFIAQEVEKVLPDVVATDSKGYKAVSYQSIVPVLVESVKALKQQNEDLAARNDELAAHNKALEAKVDALARAVKEIQARR